MPSARCRLVVERLDDRCLPALLGLPWPDPGHLTLSFAPDGTQVDNTPSGLFQKLNGQAATKVWETELLRALQTWAVSANINLGVMPDRGQALGSAGPIQGSADFGDIRVLPPAAILETVPHFGFV